MTGARIELNGADATIATLGQAEAALQNPFEMYESIGEVMVQSTRERFDDGEGPDGSPWPISLRAQFEGGQTLVDTGALKKSITHIASADQVEIGTNMDYAATHQFGAEIEHEAIKSADSTAIGLINSWTVTIPARPFIGLSEDDKSEIEAIANDFLAEALGEIGRAG